MSWQVELSGELRSGETFSMMFDSAFGSASMAALDGVFGRLSRELLALDAGRSLDDVARLELLVLGS